MQHRITKRLLVAGSLLLGAPAYGQQVNLYCNLGTGGLNPWQPCSAANPLAVSASFTPSGTQNVNITQILSAAPSLTNPLWVFPATGATFPVSGTVAATIADGADVAEGATTDAAATAGSTGSLSAKLRLMTTQFNTLNTTVATAANQTTMATNQTAVQGPVPAGAATATKFNLIGGENRTTAPTLTDGQQSPMQLETRGAQKVSPYSGATAIADATGGTWTQGAVASGATDTGNPVKVGGKYSSTLPTYTNGQRGDLQITTRGALAVSLYNADTATNFNAVSNVTNSAGSAVIAAGVVAQLDDTSTATCTENNYCPPRITANRALVMKPYSTTAGGDWTYAAAASGISNTTTAVTIKTAGSGTDRNCVTGIQLASDALGAATEFAVRDGAGGTVLWRTKIGTSGYVNGYQTAFPTPICGTAATLLEVVTLTASITGAVYVNAQGYAAP